MAIVAVMIVIVGYGYRSATKLPDNNPESFLASDKKAGKSGLMYKAIFCCYILGQSWDEISESNGFVFLTDNLHLNRRGALMATQLIDDFLAVS